MANPQQQENMLLTEHFSWPPIVSPLHLSSHSPFLAHLTNHPHNQSLIDDIINTVNEVLYRLTDTFESGISSAPPHLLGFADRYAAEGRKPSKDDDGNESFPDAALEIEEGVLKLETLMENAVDKNFDKLEIWTLRNVLCLPRGEEELARWVRLGHYGGVDVDAVRRRDGDEKDGVKEQLTPEKLYAVRRKLVETQKLNAALVAEKARNEALLAQLRGLLAPRAEGVKRESTAGLAAEADGRDGAFAFLAHTPAAQNLGVSSTPVSASASAINATPLATHTSFTTSQLPHLRQLLANLRPHLASTALPPAPREDDTNDSSRERKVYLESQSKRILERRGVDTREGVEGAVEGGRVRAEEVRGLEGIVEALDKKKKGARADSRGEEQEEAEAMDMDTS